MDVTFREKFRMVPAEKPIGDGGSAGFGAEFVSRRKDDRAHRGAGWEREKAFGERGKVC